MSCIIQFDKILAINLCPTSLGCGSQVEVISNCGHMILLEEADQALAIIKKFITTNHPSN